MTHTEAFQQMTARYVDLGMELIDNKIVLIPAPESLVEFDMEVDLNCELEELVIPKESKKSIAAKEETFEALKTLMFYHPVYVETKMKGETFFNPGVSLTDKSLKHLEEYNHLIEEIKLLFKPDFT